MTQSREEDLFNKNLLFSPQKYLLLRWGSWNLHFLVSLLYRCYMLKMVKIGSVVLEKKMLTDDTRRKTDDARHTTTDANP